MTAIIQYLPGFIRQIAALSLWLALLSLLFIPLERLFALHDQRIFRKGMLVDLGYFFLSGILPTLLLSLPVAMLAWAAHQITPGSLTALIAGWPLWLKIVAALVVADIGSYWGHRLSHEIPFLWRFHMIHHAPEEMDFMVNTHAHPIDMAFTRLCGLAPLYILGLAAPGTGTGSMIPLIVMLVGTAWGFFVHANLRWRFGPLEWLVSTPAFHHWHHTNDDPKNFNKNYSAMLPWVDYLFGTLYLPKHTPPRYGIDAPVAEGMIGQMVHPFRKADTPAEGAQTAGGTDARSEPPPVT